MPDILIRGMEMPSDRRVELLVFPNGYVGIYDVRGRYLANARAVPLPEGHGRLIDAERFRVILCRLKDRMVDDEAIHAVQWAIECLDKLDTIVPAEGGGEECSEN